MEEYKIEKGIKIPERKRKNNSKYPFDKMKVGDSFFVKCKKNVLSKTQAILTTNAAHSIKRKGLNFKFTSRVSHEPIGIRIWRIK